MSIDIYDKYNLGKNKHEEKYFMKKRREKIKTENINKINKLGIYGNLLASLSNTTLRLMIEELKNENI